MFHGHHSRAWILYSIAVSVLLAAAGKSGAQNSSPTPANQPTVVVADGSTHGPMLRSRPSRAPRHIQPTIDIRTAWGLGLPAASPRGAECLFDNGAPLDDFNDPASQLSESISPSWDFVAASADDFMVGTPADTDLCRITLIRAAFHLNDDGSGNPTPINTWDSVFVTVYQNDTSTPPDEPSGLPNNMGGQTGQFIVSQEVPVGSLLNETAVGECRICYVIDIPVNFLVHKGVKYWLSIVPRHDGFKNETQSFWCLSEVPASGGDDDAQQYFPPFITDWADVDGNTDECFTEFGPNAYKNLAFTIMTSSSESAVTGACCDDTTGGPTGTCSDATSVVNCQKANDRFAPTGTCATISPPCGTNEPGACCSDLGTCVGTMTPQQCTLASGQWHPGDCSSFVCPAGNDDCVDQIPLSGTSVSTPFNSSTVTVDAGEPLTNCGAILQDVWFSYETACDGTVTISTLGSSFDTVLAVYGPSASCPTTCPLGSPDGDYTELACNDDIINSTDSYVVLPVTAGQCLLIRVGGRSGASPTGGDGILNIDCVLPGSGACCHADLSCDLVDESACIFIGDIFTPGQPCSAAVTCPPACCLGDLDNNCLVDTDDVPLFVDIMLDPSSAGAEAFCRADVNRDFALNALDIQPFVRRIMDAASCSVSCCPGDLNGDGLLDSLDLQGMVNALLNPPPCSSAEFCRADVNEDRAIDTFDVETLIDRLLAGDTCPLP